MRAICSRDCVTGSFRLKRNRKILPPTYASEGGRTFHGPSVCCVNPTAWLNYNNVPYLSAGHSDTAITTFSITPSTTLPYLLGASGHFGAELHTGTPPPSRKITAARVLVVTFEVYSDAGARSEGSRGETSRCSLQPPRRRAMSEWAIPADGKLGRG